MLCQQFISKQNARAVIAVHLTTLLLAAVNRVRRDVFFTSERGNRTREQFASRQ